jgi:2-alkyl-3-oxoalkanoate reductase
MPGDVAIVGAGGFVGARFLERATLDGRTDVVPVVRAFRSLARNAHLGIPHRLGDAARPETLARAFAGCEAVVNLAVGDPSEILREAESVYAAAVAADVRLLVHLSSATVYGQVDRPNLPDDAPPQRDHWMLYARQKGLVENFLRERMGDRRLAIVVLRPGLIWGPGSPWLLEPARELMRGSAYLVGDGGGVCNLMYVDNLVRSIDAVVRHRPRSSGFFHVGDDETTTWRKYYGALAGSLGVEMATVRSVSGARYSTSVRDRLNSVQATATYRWLKARLSLETRTAMKLRLRRSLAQDPVDPLGTNRGPVVTRPMWHLQTTRHSLPTAKFLQTFGHQNQTSFSSGVAASVAWLRFIGLAQPVAPERVVEPVASPAFTSRTALSLASSLSAPVLSEPAHLSSHGEARD